MKLFQLGDRTLVADNLTDAKNICKQEGVPCKGIKQIPTDEVVELYNYDNEDEDPESGIDARTAAEWGNILQRGFIPEA